MKEKSPTADAGSRTTAFADAKKDLAAYFTRRPDVAMAFLFGSRGRKSGGTHAHSDWDIGIYFTPRSPELEFENSEGAYPEEDRVWADLTEILHTDDIDLVVLNRAPASIAATALSGAPLVIKDRGLWVRFMLVITRMAEEYRASAREYHEIVRRSRSLAPQDRERLERLADFLEEQAGLYPVYRGFTQNEYEDDPRKRNEIERWLENIVNAVIDAGKVMLGSEKRLIPATYREIARRGAHRAGVSNDFAARFDGWVRLRNVLAHEYLDIKWKRIAEFASTSEPTIRQFISGIASFLAEAKGRQRNDA